MPLGTDGIKLKGALLELCQGGSGGGSGRGDRHLRDWRGGDSGFGGWYCVTKQTLVTNL